MALLKLENVTVNYGSINALRGINLEVNEGEIVTLIGSNGAGKSTTMRTVMGLKHCDQGKIFFGGEEITNKDTQVMVRKGMILSPEGRQVFPRFSVLDNLHMGAYSRPDSEIAGSLDTVFSLFPKLYDRRGQIAGTLSGGEQQMLAVGRAMMGIKEIFDMIDKIRDMGTTILLVEQNARVALRHSDRAYVLETGKIVLQDTAEALLKSDVVREAYLGGL